MRRILPSTARIRLSGVLSVATVAAILLAGFLRLPAADLEGPTPSDRRVALVVTSLLQQQHLSKHELDDEIAKRGLKSFLKRLDSMKLYFLQSDVDEFRQRANQLDDEVKSGDISFAYKVYNRFLQRVDERVAYVEEELLKRDYDFTRDEYLITDPEKLKYAADRRQAEERWRKRIKYDLLVLKSEDTEGEEALERLSRRYQSFAKRMHQFKNDDLLEMYLTSMISSLDPHTTYMSPSSLDNFRIMMGLKLEGIGAALQMEDGYTKVTKVIPGGAADKAGELKPEDRIVSVGQGEDEEMVDTIDMRLDDVVKMIRGEAGTVVRLGVIPAGANKKKIIKITRASIELKDSQARSVIFEEGQKPDGTPYKLGVIDLPSFYMDMDGARNGDEDYRSTTRDVRKILDNFNAKGVDAVVLDLRRNGGGSLVEAINLTGLFINEGPVVQVKGPEGSPEKYNDLDSGMAWKGPLVVVTSQFSASASEILAGALQDYGRALVVGDDATHGKGTVQSLLDLGSQLFRISNPPNLGALKITMQKFYRPSGDSTQKRGVEADIPLPSLTNHMDVSESDLDYALEFDRVPKAEFERYNMVNENLVRELISRSEARRQESEKFVDLRSDIERYVEQKRDAKVSLNEEEFFARRAEFDAGEEDEKTFEEQVNGSDEVVERDYYFNEVLAIALDYVKSLGKNKIAQVQR